MFRMQRLLLLAVLALTFGLAVAPAYAIEAVPIPINCSLTAVGAGGTKAEAIDNALDKLAESWWITSYTVVRAFCSEVRIYTGNPLHPYDTVTLCSAEVSACGILKSPLHFP
jgi:hypothetical protein